MGELQSTRGCKRLEKSTGQDILQMLSQVYQIALLYLKRKNATGNPFMSAETGL